MCLFFSQLHQLPNKICQLSLSFLVCYDNNRPPNNGNNQLPKKERSFSEDNVIAAPLHILHKDYFSVVMIIKANPKRANFDISGTSFQKISRCATKQQHVKALDVQAKCVCRDKYVLTTHTNTQSFVPTVWTSTVFIPTGF